MSSLPVDYVKVASLKPSFQNLNLVVKIVNISPTFVIQSKKDGKQHLAAEALVGDETGTITLTLWEDHIRRFKTNDIVELRGAYTGLFKGSLRLNVGKNGRIEKAKERIVEVNMKNNLSEKTYIQIPWHLSESRPFKKKRKR